MARILKYRKITDQYTTYALVEPDYNLQPDPEIRCTELCTIDGITYVSVPDAIELPAQPEQIIIEEVALTDELKAAIERNSRHLQLIDERVVAKIREQYAVNDEIKLLRLAPSPETEAWNDYAEACRAWGREEKAKLGF